MDGARRMLVGRRFLPGGGAIYAGPASWRLFTFAGLFNLFAAAFLWSAISVGDVTVVLPLSRITPLWVVLLSHVFLKHIERLTLRILLSAILVAVGGVLITATE
ncbi:EamA family transporter [Nitrospinota bacterium]